ncbi:MAG: hypothetical protein HC934_06210, partial [Acaryochloridaceae cyanobacterium SU_2_1]|nr:hypothetical protein [Acaryochloridaceae cyanobacterium SU_2_1]
MSLNQGRQTPTLSTQKISKTAVALAFTAAFISLGATLFSRPAQAKPILDPLHASSAPFQIAAQSSNIAQMENEVWQQINSQRQRYGLPPLAMNGQLSQVARNHSQQMAQHNFYSHIGRQGETHRQRVEAAGLR